MTTQTRSGQQFSTRSKNGVLEINVKSRPNQDQTSLAALHIATTREVMSQFQDWGWENAPSRREDSKMELIKTGNRFEMISHYDDRHILKEAGFHWNPRRKRWGTFSPRTAAKLIKYASPELADEIVVQMGQ